MKKNVDGVAVRLMVVVLTIGLLQSTDYLRIASPALQSNSGSTKVVVARRTASWTDLLTGKNNNASSCVPRPETIQHEQCLKVLGKNGTWIQDWEFAAKYGQHQTPPVKESGPYVASLLRRFRPSEEAPYRFETSWRWVDHNNLEPSCQVDYTLDGPKLYNVLHGLDIGLVLFYSLIWVLIISTIGCESHNAGRKQGNAGHEVAGKSYRIDVGFELSLFFQILQFLFKIHPGCMYLHCKIGCNHGSQRRFFRSR